MTEQGRHFAEEVLDIKASTVTQCPTCNGSGLKELDPKLIKKLQILLVDAPNVRVELDQAPCTAETALHRAELMHKAGALEGRNILLLGDDDSLSLAIPLYLAHMGRNRAVDNITVLELDPGRIGFLEQKCEEVGAAITIVQHDLRDPLPTNLKGQFDTFQTDPLILLRAPSFF
ncbi:bis-aminopropyl spermidine synthase family protein (plasmid) [Microbulbifer sp. MKSA007]|nr:bis-aminopropyl spermidine synthase family protein [Microbulbifer sp. MKSA007]